MCSAVNLMDPLRLCYDGDFEAQVQNILNRVRLTATEVRNLRNVFSDLELALQNLSPGLQVHPFGSIVTGLGIRTSDVDCFILLPVGEIPNEKHVIQARNILQQHRNKFSDVFAIINAKVPIVKFLHVPTNCYCDINFTSPFGVHNSKFISFVLQMDPSGRVLRLAILIKYWSKVHKFTGTNLLSSYALTILVIFYLQLMNMVPSVYELQKNVSPCMIQNWNMAFDRNVSFKSNDDSLYDLLGGFFKCYATIDFEETIISTYMGRLLSRQSFRNFEEVPPEYELYLYNITDDICPNLLKTGVSMCIQDPFEHNKNCSASVYPALAAKIKGHFQFAASKFDEVPPESFFRTIFTEDPTKLYLKVRKQPDHIFLNKIMKHPPPFQKGRGARKKLNISQFKLLRNQPNTD